MVSCVSPIAVLVSVLALFANGIPVPPPAGVNPIVALDYGSFMGYEVNGVNKWKGIPFAAPPIGDLRFRALQPPYNFTGVFNASSYGYTCHSTDMPMTDGFSEDCLTLNVYAPANTTNVPVYIFIQGGGFNTLSNRNFDGETLVRASGYNIAVVTFNYRVSAYGFLASKEVQANGDLNVGLLDQRKVFEWVRDYITAFGGNPGSVAIGGDSAGGASVDLQLSAYGGRDDGLFHRAAGESQSFGAQFTVGQSQYQYNHLVNGTGCSMAADTLACLRSLNETVLQNANTDIPTPGGAGGKPLFMYSNVIDGNFTREYTYLAFESGKYINIPVIFGDVTNEGTIFTPTWLSSYPQLNNFIKDNFPLLSGAQLAQIDKTYPRVGGTYDGKGPYFETGALAYGEMRYTCPGIFLSSTYAMRGPNSWNYHYDISTPGNYRQGLGVPHVQELNAIWNQTSNLFNVNDTALTQHGLNITATTPRVNYANATLDIVPVIQGYWTSFIRTGNPNTFRREGTPVWENFNVGEEKRILFQVEKGGTRMERVDEQQLVRCQYLKSLYNSTEQ